MSAHIAVELERERFLPGDTVRGRVVVVTGVNARGLEVELVYRERTRNNITESGQRTPAEVLHRGALDAGESYDFELTLPGDALPEYRAANSSLVWEVDAKMDLRGRPDVHATRPIGVDIT